MSDVKFGGLSVGSNTVPPLIHKMKAAQGKFSMSIANHLDTNPGIPGFEYPK